MALDVLLTLLRGPEIIVVVEALERHPGMMEPYCFGRFTLDPSGRRLYADELPVPLGATDFRILLALVERAGAVVTKSELVSRVWGSSVVTDNALYFHIGALRKVLGEDCIENEQRRGYRFVAPVWRTEPRAQIEPRAGNLPSLWTGNAVEGPTRLIGRGEQLRAISNLLGHGRLVTLTGPGGVGKTKLALQAAREASAHYSDGIWLVELASLKDPELIPGAIACVLGIVIDASATPLDTLQRYLEQKSLLIVLDNCEHVLMACARAAEVLLGAPKVKILATSREPLSCYGEQVLEVPPLEVPREDGVSPEAMRNMAGIELFLERATSAQANFRVPDEELPIVASICSRVDGLPLAIEMAAGWASVLGVKVLDAKLDGSLKAWLRARSTAALRHLTLHATLQWSHDLLSPAERVVLRRLGVFAASFTMHAAEAVAGDHVVPKEEIFEHVASLVRKSMLAVVPGSRVQHYRLLETTRAFVLEQLLASGEASESQRRHARYVLATLELASGEWESTSDAVWMERYGPLLDDLRAALDRTLADDSNEAVALAGASWPFWRQLSLPREGGQRLSAAAARLNSDTPPALEARLRRGLGDMLLNTADTQAAHHELERAAALYRALGDPPHLGGTLAALGYALFVLDRVEEAKETIREALALLQPAGWLRTLATAYNSQMCVEAIQGRFDAARVAGEKAIRLSEMAGVERNALAVSANMVQVVHLESGDAEGAVSAGRKVAARLRDTRHSYLLGFVLGLLAGAHTALGDLNEALTVAREAAPLLRDEGRLYWLFDHLALRAALGGRARDAALIAGYAAAVYEKFGHTRQPMGRQAMERTALLLRDALTDEEISELRQLGAQLSEDQATAIALST